MSFGKESINVDYEYMPVREETKNILIEQGFLTNDDFEGAEIGDLRKLGVDSKEARIVLRYVRSVIIPDKGETAADQMRNSKNQRNHIFTFCKEIDKMLGGGFEMNSVTEICGAPGIGKTQFGIQMCVNVQIPKILGGVEGEAVYIDTEGSFMLSRVESVARGFVKKVNGMFLRSSQQQGSTEKDKKDVVGDFPVLNDQKKKKKKKPKPKMTDDGEDEEEEEEEEEEVIFPDEKRFSSSPDQMTAEEVMDRIHYYRVNHFVELISLVNILPRYLESNIHVRLIVIDSITFHFRHVKLFKDMSHRARILQSMASKLAHMAHRHNVCIIVVNQVTTKINRKQAHLEPALGNTWAHACKNRVILYRKGSKRKAYLYKSPTLKPSKASFTITLDGIRDATKKRTREQRDMDTDLVL